MRIYISKLKKACQIIEGVTKQTFRKFFVETKKAVPLFNFFRGRGRIKNKKTAFGAALNFCYILIAI